MLLSAAVALGGSLVAATTALALTGGSNQVALLVPLALAAVTVFLALALARIEVFVLALLVTRTSLDAMSLGSTTLDPAAVLGMMLLGAGTVWLVAAWREDGRITASPLGWAALAFTAAGLVGVAVAPAYGPALVEWTRLASVCLILLVVERLARRPAFRARVVVALVVASVVPLAFVVWQTWTNSGLFEAGGFQRASGTFAHPNSLAAFLAVIVVLAFAHVVHVTDLGPRVGWLLVLVATGAGLFTTYTRAAWIAALLGVLVVSALYSRRLLAAVGITLLLVTLTVPGVSSRFSDLGEASTSRGEPSNSLTWRAEYWGEALDLVHDQPLTGIGLKQVAARTLEGKQPHNDFLRAYVEMGLLGLAAYLALAWQLLATAWRSVRASRYGPRSDQALAASYAGVAAGYVLMSLVANLMSQVVVGLYVMALAGAGAALVTAASRDREQQRVVSMVGRGT